MIDIIYKTVKPSHLKKLQIFRNINSLFTAQKMNFSIQHFFSKCAVNLTSLLHIFWLNFDKANKFPLPLSAVGGQIFRKKRCLEESVTFLCLGFKDNDLGACFE